MYRNNQYNTTITLEEIRKIRLEYESKQAEELGRFKKEQRESLKAYMEPFENERIEELNTLGIEPGDIIFDPKVDVSGMYVKVEKIKYHDSKLAGIPDYVEYIGVRYTKQLTPYKNRDFARGCSHHEGLRLVKNREELMNK